MSDNIDSKTLSLILELTIKWYYGLSEAQMEYIVNEPGLDHHLSEVYNYFSEISNRKPSCEEKNVCREYVDRLMNVWKHKKGIKKGVNGYDLTPECLSHGFLYEAIEFITSTPLNKLSIAFVSKVLSTPKLICFLRNNRIFAEKIRDSDQQLHWQLVPERKFIESMKKYKFEVFVNPELASKALNCDVEENIEDQKLKKRKIHMAKLLREATGTSDISYIEVQQDIGYQYEESHLDTIKYCIWDFIEPNIQLLSYNCFKFKPYPPGKTDPCSSNTINLFGGFRVVPVNGDIKKIHPILNHILEVFCSGDNLLYNYVLDILAWHLQKPDQKLPLCLLLIGLQGCGKDILFTEFIIPLIYGSEFAIQINGVRLLTQRFNSTGGNKVFITCSESNITSTDVNGTMKNLITQKRRRIEPKGLEPYDVDDYVNYVFTSNEFDQKMVERGDRRFFALNCSSKYVGNRQYIANLLTSFTEINAGIYAGMLLKRDLSKFDPMAFPKTELHKYLSESSKDPIIDFFDSWMFGIRKGNTWYPNGALTNESVKYTILYTYYCEWCKYHDEKPKSKIALTRLIKEQKLKGTLHITCSEARHITLYSPEKSIDIKPFVVDEDSWYVNTIDKAGL